MENMRSAFQDLTFSDAVRRYVLSFKCASGNPCLFSLSAAAADGTVLKQFPAETLNSIRNPNYALMRDVYENHTYIKFLNGLTCLARDGNVLIGNSATNEEFRLPYFPGLHSYADKESFFFCHHPAAGQYKVVAAVATSLRKKHQNIVERRFSVFTLGVDTSWREIQNNKDLYQYGYSESSSVCIDGVLFSTDFSTSRDYFEDRIIAAFDVGRECFDIVDYPDGLQMPRRSRCRLINLKGSLAVADVEDDDVGSWVIRLWIKVEGFGNWVKNRVRFPSPMLEITLSVKSCGFSLATNGNGEMVMGIAKMSSPRCWVFVCNMESGEWRRIGMFLIKGHAIVSDFVVEEYVKTTLSPRGIVGS